MDFSKLTEMFESYTGTSSEIDPAQLALWLNEAQLDLSSALSVPVKYTYMNVLAGEEYELPAGCMRIVDALANYSETPDGKIVFATGGDIDIYYRGMPTPFTGVDMTQTSALPEATHHLMAIFAASRYWDMESEGDGEESNHATKWMNYYLMGKQQAISVLDVAGTKVDRWMVV